MNLMYPGLACIAVGFALMAWQVRITPRVTDVTTFGYHAGSGITRGHSTTLVGPWKQDANGVWHLDATSPDPASAQQPWPPPLSERPSPS